MDVIFDTAPRSAQAKPCIKLIAAFLGVSSLTLLKSRLKAMVRPLAAKFADVGVTANQVRLASLIGSIAVGAVLCAGPSNARMFALLPLWLLVRTACAALDGTLAIEFGQKSRFGGILNEVGDIASDVALFLPLAFVAPFSLNSIVLLIMLIVFAEIAGIVGPLLGCERRLEGPLGKADRSIILAIFAIVIAIFGALPESANTLPLLLYGGLILTIWNRLRFAMADGRAPKVTFGKALTGTVFLARRLRSVWRDQNMVGILLPPSVPGALINLAALLMGKVPVNLNYTASNEVLASCAKQCELKTVITSKAFLERVHLEVPAQAIMLEDLAANPRLAEKIAAAFISWLLPVRLIEKSVGSRRKTKLDDIATIIFSSGSTGDPKGVVLSHYNVASNVEQLNQVFMLGRNDKILGILPFFHSFGFTGTLCLPTTIGMGVVYHPSPLESRAIGALVSQYGVTFLLATPTFLSAYIRRCEPEDFGSLQYVMAGAEKLPERTSIAFEDRFGIRPLEGYGCTECSPAVTVNTRDFRAAQFRQVGAKRSSIGHPLPGISVRIVNPETLEPLPLGDTGLLLVRGPNVMQGYLNRPEKTAEVLRDGWYNTGDIAAVDEDGFIRITDRMSRFSKIGGEMVPHIKVEDKLHELSGATEQTFAVTAVPDEKKGERLIVLHTLPEDKLEPCLALLAKSDLPALWKPRPDQFVHVDLLPYLGTGKLDLRRLKEIAAASV